MKEMASSDQHLHKAEEILAVSAHFEKVQPNPFLEAKIMGRLEREMTSKPESAWSLGWILLSLKLGALTALIVVNALTFLWVSKGNSQPAEQQNIAQTYWNYEELIIQ